MMQNLNLLSVFVMFIIAIEITTQENIRFTISGKQCIFPSKYKDTVHNNCILNEKGQEWCYTDNLNISWDFCSRGDFQIVSSILIKNINFDEKKQKIENCLFLDKLSKKIFATSCNVLLSIKSKNLEKFLDVSQFEFFWLNDYQIKTKSEKCLHPVETSIIKNSIISYHGFIDVRDCIIDSENFNLEKEKENFLQFWKINENNRIINKHNKKCLVVSKENSPISDLFKKEKRNFLQQDGNLFSQLGDFVIFEVFLGDCYGNTIGYEGRENFILEEFKTEKLEMMALNKLINVYKKGAENIENLINKSSEDMIKLIKINSNLIDKRQLIDTVENKLEESQTNFDRLADNDDVESFYEKDGRLKKSNLDFEIYGLVHEKINIQEKKDKNGNISIEPQSIDFDQFESLDDPSIKSLQNILFISSPNVENNQISVYNMYDILNDFYSSNFLEDKISHKIKLDDFITYPIKNKFIFKTSGYLVNNNITINCETESIQLKIETNLRFKIIMNNNIIFSNDDYFNSLKNLNFLSKNSPDEKRPKVNFYEISTFNSKSFCLNKNTLNQISIFYQFYYDKSNEENSDENNKENFGHDEFLKFFNKKKSDIFSDNKAHFILSYIKQGKVYNFKTTDFIPFAPYENFTLGKQKILEDAEVLSCKISENSISFAKKSKNKIFICPEICQEEKNSLCKIVYNNGIIPNSGGSFIITKQNQNLKYYATEYPKAGLDYMMTDLKLGYEEDFKKFSQQSNALLFKNYMVKIEVNSTLNEDDAFLFYKKDLIYERMNFNGDSENKNFDNYIILNVKLICDNSEELSDDSRNFGEKIEGLSDSINSEKQYYESLNLRIKIEKIHDIINSYTIIIFKTPYKDYLKSFKTLRYLDDVDLKMFKKSEIFKFNSKKNEYVYDQFICVTDNKKIILKTKHNKFRNFPALPDYISTLSTTLTNIIDYMNTNQMSEINVQCVLTIKDFEAKLNSAVGEANSHSLCLRAYEDGLINKYGSVFRILKVTDKKILFENLVGTPVYSIHSTDVSLKNSKELGNGMVEEKYRIYQTLRENLEDFQMEFFDHFVNRIDYMNNFSSFIEMSTNTKFYSGDLLIKIEDGMNHITEKIIESSKKISELTKINEDLEKKIKKIEGGKNSIDVINNRVNEISKVEINLEERIKKKFMKYQKILKEKDTQIDYLHQHNRQNLYLGVFNPNSFIFDLKNHKNFFNNWIIIDSIHSLNGPSNWNLSKIKSNIDGKEIVILQQSSIISNNNMAQASTSILFRNKIFQENIYFKLIFLAKFSGGIFINFKHIDNNNYLQLYLSRETENKGKISLVLMKKGKSVVISDLDCEKMVSFLKKCDGFEIETLAKIEIYSFKSKFVVIYNDMIIFTVSLFDLLKNEINSIVNGKNSSSKNENFDWLASRILIGLNNQKNFEMHELQIKNMDLNDIKVFQSEINEMKTYARGRDYKILSNNTNDIHLKNNLDDGSLAGKIIIKLSKNENLDREKTETENNLKSSVSGKNNKKIRYNSKTNTFDEIPEQKDLNLKDKNSKKSNDVNLMKQKSNIIRNSDIINNIEEDSKKNVIEYKKFLFEKCLMSEKEKYVCNYISNILSKHKIDIKIGKTEDIANVIKENCMHTMKNASLCNQIIQKIEPIIENLKLITSISSPFETRTQNTVQKETKILKDENILNIGQNIIKKRDINLLISSCNFEFLPALQKNRKICLNDILTKELENRKYDMNDNCVKEFCLNCCYVNYGNNQCRICKK